MADELGKIYEPEVTSSAPFPQGDQQESSVTQSSAGGIHSPTTTQAQAFPQKKIATELLSTALNTKSKKIQQEFQFTKQGAIQVGEYQNGVSGDVKISPNGIVARDQSGNTTFTLDGDTGDAVFAGELRSGTLVTGNVDLVDGAKITIPGAGEVAVIDSLGLISTASFPFTPNISGNPNQQITSTSNVDITNASTTITVPRAARLLLLFYVDMCLLETAGSNDGRGAVYLTKDGAEIEHVYVGTKQNDFSTYSTFSFISLDKGTYVFKLVGRIQSVYNGTPILYISGFNLQAVFFGS